MLILQIYQLNYSEFGAVSSRELVNQQYFIKEERDKAEEIMIRLNAHFCERSPEEPAKYKAVIAEVN